MNLLEIAKSCGAERIEAHDEFTQSGVFLQDDQLHAYTEQVCKQMVEALQSYRDAEMNGLGAVFNTPAKEALAAHKQMMGDRHE